MTNGTCDETRSRLSAFLDGDLGPEETAAVRSHLEACASCRTELDALRLTVGALRRLPDLPAPAGILAGVRARLAPEPWHRRFLHRASRNWLVGVPIGAVATLLVVAAAALFQDRFPEMRKEVAPPTTRPAARQATPPSGAPAAIVESAPSTAPAPAMKPTVVAPAATAGVKSKAEAAPAETSITAQAGRAPADVYREEEPEAAVAEPGQAPPPAQSFAVRDTVDERRDSEDTLGATEGDRDTAGGMIAGDIETVGSDTEPAEGARPPAAFRDEGSSTRAVSGVPAPTGKASVAKGVAVMRERVAERRPGSGTPAAGNEEKGREPLEVLYVWSQDGDDVEELRRIIKREGGSLLQVRAMDSRTGREALVPIQQQMIPTSGHVRNAWEIQAKVPRRNLDRILRDVQRRPGYQLLQRQPAELPPGPPSEHQNLKIRLFR